MDVRTTVEAHPILSFVFGAYAFSWLVWGIQIEFVAPESPVATALFFLGGLGPLISAVIVSVQLGTLGELRSRLFLWRVAPRWYLLALVVPVTMAIGFIGWSVAIGARPFGLDETQPVVLLPAFLLSGFLFGGLEEPGWRGFAQVYLQRRYSAFSAALGIGVVWAGWHLPLFVRPETTQSSLPFGLYLALGLALSVLIAWCFNSSGHSVPVAMMFHAAFNASQAWTGVLESDRVVLTFLGVVLVTAAVATGIVGITGRATLSSGSVESSVHKASP